MPLRIQDIKRSLNNFYQRSKENIVSLGNDSALDKDFKPVKIGDKVSRLELSNAEVKVNGSLDVESINKSVHFKYDTTRYLTVESSKASNDIISTGTTVGIKIVSDDNFWVDADGDIILDSNDGNFIAKKAGVEFSADNSAYAGMTLGYTSIGLNEAPATYNLTTSYVVPTDEFSVAFVAPPSGKVEIFIQVGWDAGSGNLGDCFAGLSTANATSGYSATVSYHEKELFDGMSRGALRVITHRWTITGLTAGTAYERWAGFKTTNTSGTPHLQWGGNGSGENPNFIMKATALPETITT